jgi:hypothetical protein
MLQIKIEFADGETDIRVVQTFYVDARVWSFEIAPGRRSTFNKHDISKVEISHEV